MPFCYPGRYANSVCSCHNTALPRRAVSLFKHYTNLLYKPRTNEMKSPPEQEQKPMTALRGRMYYFIHTPTVDESLVIAKRERYD
jgi:hypothetical protein